MGKAVYPPLQCFKMRLDTVVLDDTLTKQESAISVTEQNTTACAIQEVTLILTAAFPTSCAAAVSSSPSGTSHLVPKLPFLPLLIALFLLLLLNPKSP